MAEQQPDTPLSNNMYSALDIVGQTQLVHVGGYRDKSLLGVAMGNNGGNVRIGAMKHYLAKRLQPRLKSPYIHYNHPANTPKEPVEEARHKQKFSPKGNLMPLHAPLADRFGRDIDRGR
jgi:hypothetical protein